MNIQTISLGSLQNAEHFNFMTEFRDLIFRAGAVQLGVEKPFNNLFEPLYKKEDEAFLLIRKSSITEDLAVLDHERDLRFAGLMHLINAYTLHYEPEVAAKAKKVKVLMDAYGNVTKKNYDSETAEIINLIDDLKDKYPSEITALNLSGWLTALKSANDDFARAKDERYTESSGKTDIRMKNIRLEVDEAYRTITGTINAYIIIEGEEKYHEFVKELNLRINHYKTLIAQRKGRK